MPRCRLSLDSDACVRAILVPGTRQDQCRMTPPIRARFEHSISTTRRSEHIANADAAASQISDAHLRAHRRPTRTKDRLTDDGVASFAPRSFYERWEVKTGSQKARSQAYRKRRLLVGVGCGITLGAASQFRKPMRLDRTASARNQQSEEAALGRLLAFMGDGSAIRLRAGA
jgi:hypothetical protein